MKSYACAAAAPRISTAIPRAGEIVDTRGYAGIVAYEPSELVVTARCGTPLAELEGILAQNRQCLPFEPPHFGAAATVGGCIAAGLSGPGRAAAGALRDFVLGIKLIDGRAQALQFGGQVMKNVAGYDVSRLIAGSLGTLGLIAEVSLKLAPRPQSEATLRLEMPQARALETMNRWAGQPLPVSATAWHDGELMVRLSGSTAGVRAAAAKIGGEAVGEPILERHPRAHRSIFRRPRAAVAALAALDRAGAAAGRAPALEWNGGLRWLKSGSDPALVREAAQRVKGNATLFRAERKERQLLRAARPGARARAPGAQGGVRPGRHFQPRPPAAGTLGLGELFLLRFDCGARLRAERALRVPRDEAGVQLDRKHRLAGLAGFRCRLEQQFLLCERRIGRSGGSDGRDGRGGRATWSMNPAKRSSEARWRSAQRAVPQPDEEHEPRRMRRA